MVGVLIIAYDFQRFVINVVHSVDDKLRVLKPSDFDIYLSISCTIHHIIIVFAELLSESDIDILSIYSDGTRK